MSLVDTTEGRHSHAEGLWLGLREAGPQALLQHDHDLRFGAWFLIVGGLETLNLIGDKLGLKGNPWETIGAVNDNFGILGYLIIGVFVATWAISALFYRLMGYDRLEPLAARPGKGLPILKLQPPLKPACENEGSEREQKRGRHRGRANFQKLNSRTGFALPLQRNPPPENSRKRARYRQVRPEIDADQERAPLTMDGGYADVTANSAIRAAGRLFVRLAPKTRPAPRSRRWPSPIAKRPISAVR